MNKTAFKMTLLACALLVLTSVDAYAKKFTYIGELGHVTAEYEDTLVHIARKHNLGFIDIRAANPTLDPWIPGAGANVLLPTMHILPDADQKGIVINLPEMRLYYFPTDGSEPLSYGIGIGREGLETPTGLTKIVRKQEGPSWTPTQRMLDEDPELKPFYPPGPENPLGTHAMYLDWPLYRIHGTNKPYGIGRRVSSGCIRMYPEGIIDIYGRIKNGTPVNVINQPVKAGWINDEFYIEATPTIQDANNLEKGVALGTRNVSQDDIAYIRSKAGVSADQLDWDMVRDVINSRLGYPIKIDIRNGKTPQKAVENEAQQEKEAKLEAPASKEEKTADATSSPKPRYQLNR